MQRIPEPELMDDPAQALAYARADFTEPHNHFVDLLREHCRVPDGYNLVFSNSLLHHLADPAVLWDTLRQAARPGAPLFVMDLRRPDSAEDALRLVEHYAGDEPDVLRHDFHQSLLAAYTPDEVAVHLAAADLQSLQVEVVGDRHLIVHGVRP
jgi:SAM-dependent methyltransferase